MIARKKLPPAYREWNRRHDAPFGRLRFLGDGFRRALPLELSTLLYGSFSIQTNNTFRAYEYPWAFEVGQIERGQRVFEIGGGLSGFQFVLARAGCQVVNVDPGMEAKGKGWPCDPARMKRLNRALLSSVELRNTTVRDAALEPESFDRAFSISVLEHLPESEIEDVMRAVYASLKPGGRFVITTDLFLDLEPFTDRKSNAYGQNVSVKWLSSLAPFRLDIGDPAELYGFEQFEPRRILANLSDYFVGSYPALAQLFVLVKPA